MTPVDVLGSATLYLSTGVVLSALSVVATIAVVIAGVKLVTIAFSLVAGVATGDAILALTCYICL